MFKVSHLTINYFIFLFLQTNLMCFWKNKIQKCLIFSLKYWLQLIVFYLATILLWRLIYYKIIWKFIYYKIIWQFIYYKIIWQFIYYKIIWQFIYDKIISHLNIIWKFTWFQLFNLQHASNSNSSRLSTNAW